MKQALLALLPHHLMKTYRLQSKRRGLFNDKNLETVGEIYFIVYKLISYN